jgi:two-component system chemotaxis response regulator CheB
MADPRRFRAVVVGVSSGGVQALTSLLGALPAAFALPILIVQHIGADAGDGLARLLDVHSSLQVREADEQDMPQPGKVYLAPANYHLLVEPDGRLSLSADAPVSYARPSVDVLFESAAEVFGPALIGVVLTGANHDGSRGLARIKQLGGIAIVQDPADAEAPQMPMAALAATAVDHVVPLAAIAPLLSTLAGGSAACLPDKATCHV